MQNKLNKTIEKTLKTKGETWIIAAMIDGSIGYHSAKHAQQLIEKYVKGDTQDHCERCLSCFKADLEAMILHDIKCFEHVPQDKQQKLIKFAKSTMNLTEMEQTTIGLMYPTMGF